MISSRLDQPVEIKINSVPRGETFHSLPPFSALPSFLIAEGAVRSLRVRLQGGKTGWSSDVIVYGEKKKDHRFLKVLFTKLL